MIREVNIAIDRGTWPSGIVPRSIGALVGPWSANVLLALLHTAIWTRPPGLAGFHLSSVWAWLRYGPAIATSSDLRLCSEWSAIDSHQKAVLSDELGVGFSTYLLAEKLGILEFADTNYVVNVLAPHKFALLPSAKVGPKKSPDYIGRDGHGAYCVLECKGTQSSIRALNTALDRGVSQKTNLVPMPRVRLKHSLVVGLFIPQWTSSESATIKIVDPDWSDLEEYLSTREPRDVDTSVFQIALAKELSLAGLEIAAQYLFGTATEELRQMPPSARAQIEKYASMAGQTGEITSAGDPSLVETRSIAIERTSLKFRAFVQNSILEHLHDSTHLNDALADWAESTRASSWQSVATDEFAELHAPSTIRYRLDTTNN